MSNYESLMILLALITLVIKIIELINENKKGPLNFCVGVGYL